MSISNNLLNCFTGYYLIYYHGTVQVLFQLYNYLQFQFFKP